MAILRKIGERLGLLRPLPPPVITHVETPAPAEPPATTEPPPAITHIGTELVEQEVHVRVKSTYRKRTVVRVHFGGPWTGWHDRTLEPMEEATWIISQGVNVGGVSVRLQLISVEGVA